MWRLPDVGDEAFLGGVVVSRPDRWDLFYGLVAAAARDALARGIRKASFTVSDRALLERLRRDFVIDPKPPAWEPLPAGQAGKTGRPLQWDIHVDLVDALQQLERVI